MNSAENLSIQGLTNLLQAETATSVLNPGESWSGASAVLLNQGVGAFDIPQLGFHVVEMCTNGKARASNSFDGLDGSARSEYRPNALFYIPPHRAIAGEIFSGSIGLLHLYIEDRVFLDLARETCCGDAEKIDLFGFNGRYDPSMAGIIQLIRAEMQVGGSSSAMIIDTAVQQLAILLMRQSQDVQSRAKTPRLTNLSACDFNRAMDLIEDNLSENIGLNAIAAELDISVYNFCRSFKATAGIAPHRYLMERRVAAVQNRLQHTSDPLADIAYATGFSSQAHMTTAFKKATGFTPGSFRKQIG